MAGSFGIFRQYEKFALAGLAIMAMLAFFVLPPILQMGGGNAGGSDPLVVAWNGGGLRESGVQRAVIMRKVMNQFLAATKQASGQDPSRLRLPDDEKSVVDTILMAREAEANGIAVSNTAINMFLSQWTNDLVRPEQFQEIVAQIGSRMGVSQEDVFGALRTVLLAQRMESLLLAGSGFDGAPPGWRWDYFRRLEQGATIEAVPVVGQTFVDGIPDPSEATLRSYHDRYKDQLPAARSPDPGFRQPHRARWDALVAKAGLFRDEEEKNVTDEQIKAFYEDRKAALYKAKPAAESAAAAEAKPGDGSEGTVEKAGDEAKPADAKPADAKPADAKPADDKAGPKEGAGAGRSALRTVAFRQPAAVDDKPAAAPSAAEVLTQAGATTEAAPAADESQFEPLDKVRDDIRTRLADEAAEKRITRIFEAVKRDVEKFGDSLALWQVDGDGAGPAPVSPDVQKIAEAQGLEGARSELMNAAQAFSEGGIGGSFEFAMSRELGVRQQRWIDMIYGPGAPLHQAFTSRDIEGNRYISWKIEDQTEFTPSFQAARDDVLRAWKIVEARPLARKAAEEVAAEVKAGGKTLDEVAAARGGLEVVKAGPFTWMTRGTAPFGAAPVLSQPEGLSMPGEEFMQAVFALQPGETAVAFNEPKTVCYCIRLVALEPGDAQLKDLFLAAAKDPRRLAMLAEEDTRQVYDRWMKAIEERHGVAWKREPRGSEID